MGKIISTSNYDIPYYISDNSYVSKTYKWKPLKTIYNVVYDTYIWILNNKLKIKKVFLNVSSNYNRINRTCRVRGC